MPAQRLRIWGKLWIGLSYKRSQTPISLWNLDQCNSRRTGFKLVSNIVKTSTYLTSCRAYSIIQQNSNILLPHLHVHAAQYPQHILAVYNLTKDTLIASLHLVKRAPPLRPPAPVYCPVGPPGPPPWTGGSMEVSGSTKRWWLPPFAIRANRLWCTYFDQSRSSAYELLVDQGWRFTTINCSLSMSLNSSTMALPVAFLDAFLVAFLNCNIEETFSRRSVSPIWVSWDAKPTSTPHRRHSLVDGVLETTHRRSTWMMNLVQ